MSQKLFIVLSGGSSVGRASAHCPFKVSRPTSAGLIKIGMMPREVDGSIPSLPTNVCK